MEDPLHQAVAAGDMAAVRTLLVNGAGPNVEDEEDGAWHLTPLHTAAKAGRVEVATLRCRSSRRLYDGPPTVDRMTVTGSYGLF